MSAEARRLGQKTVIENEATVGLYDQDFAGWAMRQASLIRAGHLHQLDIDNLAEEMESLGREQFDKVRSHFRVILLHLLKWDHQPDRRTRSWTLSIRESRDRIEDTIDASPALRQRRPEALRQAYRSARVRAALETDLPLSTFPEECPYSLEDILTRPVRWHDD